MAKYKITAPSGEKFEITAPDNASQEQVMAYAQQQFAAKPKMPEMPEAPKSYTGGEAAMEGAKNLVPGVFGSAIDTAKSLMHPIDTAQSVLQLGAGELAKVLPKSVTDALNRADEAVLGKQTAQQIHAKENMAANAINQQYSNRYGSMEGFKRDVAEHPEAVLADLSTVLSGGASLASKAPKLAAALNTASNVTNPLTIAGKIVSVPANMAGTAIKGTIGTTTGVGNEPLNQAIRAGEGSVLNAGNRASEAFTKNMRGAPDVQSAVEIAKSGLDKIRQAKNAEYRSGMVDISKDKSVLDFGDIEDALSSAKSKGVWEGQVKNQYSVDKVKEAEKAINDWKNLDSSKYHTPEGMDVLKQQIGAILEDIPYEKATARTAVNEVYNAVKQAIIDQAPTYSDVMKNYSQSMDLINDITKSLSLKDKTSTDTAMRKLQSVMRNNVQTNYGERAKLAEELVNKGGAETLMPTLAGQSLNTMRPRGLGGQLETYGGLGYLAFHPAALGTALMAAPFAMPRLMGEAAYAYGKGKGAVKKASEKVPFTKEQARKAAMLLQQTQPNQEEQ